MFNRNGGFVSFPMQHHQARTAPSADVRFTPPQVAQPLAWLAPILNPATLDGIASEEELDRVAGRNRLQVEIWQENNRHSPSSLFMQIDQLWQHYEFLVEGRRRKLRLLPPSANNHHRGPPPSSAGALPLQSPLDLMPEFAPPMPPLPPSPFDDDAIPPPPPESIPPPPGPAPPPIAPPLPAPTMISNNSATNRRSSNPPQDPLSQIPYPRMFPSTSPATTSSQIQHQQQIPNNFSNYSSNSSHFPAAAVSASVASMAASSNSRFGTAAHHPSPIMPASSVVAAGGQHSSQQNRLLHSVASGFGSFPHQPIPTSTVPSSGFGRNSYGGTIAQHPPEAEPTNRRDQTTAEDRLQFAAGPLFSGGPRNSFVNEDENVGPHTAPGMIPRMFPFSSTGRIDNSEFSSSSSLFPLSSQSNIVAGNHFDDGFENNHLRATNNPGGEHRFFNQPRRPPTVQLLNPIPPPSLSISRNNDFGPSGPPSHGPPPTNSQSLISPGGTRRHPLMMDFDDEEAAIAADGPIAATDDDRILVQRPNAARFGSRWGSEETSDPVEQRGQPAGTFSKQPSLQARTPILETTAGLGPSSSSTSFWDSEGAGDETTDCGYVRRDQLDSMEKQRTLPGLPDGPLSGGESYYRRSGQSPSQDAQQRRFVSHADPMRTGNSPNSCRNATAAIFDDGEADLNVRNAAPKLPELRKLETTPVVHCFDHSLILPHKYGAEFGRNDFIHEHGGSGNFESGKNLFSSSNNVIPSEQDPSGQNSMLDSSMGDYDYEGVAAEQMQQWGAFGDEESWQQGGEEYYQEEGRGGGGDEAGNSRGEEWDEDTTAAFERFVGEGLASDQTGYTISGAPPPPPPRSSAEGSSDDGPRRSSSRHRREDRRRSRSRSPMTSWRQRMDSRDSSLLRSRDDHVPTGSSARDRERERGRERDRDRMNSRDRDRERDSREHARDYPRDRDRDRERDASRRGSDRDRRRRSPLNTGSSFSEHRSSRRSRSPPSGRSSSHRDSPNTIYRSEFGTRGGLPNLMDPMGRGSQSMGSRPPGLFGPGGPPTLIGGSFGAPTMMGCPPPKVETVSVDDILNEPGRTVRPPKIVIILRGAPGAGKSYIAKLIKEREVEKGGAVPRILCLDDYFMVENETEVKDPKTGRRKKERAMQYEYDLDLEPSYRKQFFKSYKKTIDDGFFSFIIVDAVNQSLQHFDEMWSMGKHNGYQVYIVELTTDIGTCAKRNVHSRTKEEINQIMKKWEPAPPHFLRLDCIPLIQDASIQEVDMDADEDDDDNNCNNNGGPIMENNGKTTAPFNEATIIGINGSAANNSATSSIIADNDTIIPETSSAHNDNSCSSVQIEQGANNNNDGGSKTGTPENDDQGADDDDDGGGDGGRWEIKATEHREVHASKWDLIDSEAKLDKLDGMKLKKATTMADFLEVSEDYRSRTQTAGKKRVRWADIEDRQQMERQQAIGFVIGGTDWSKLTGQYDPSGALERTKYI